MKVSAVIVNFNTRELLRSALRSLPPGVEAVVVDNASVDGSADLVRKEFPSARLVENAKNRGFAAAVNQGVAASSGDAFLLLNSDARLEPGALEALERRLESEPRAAAVGARLVGGGGHLQPSTYPPLSLGLELLETLRAYRWLPRKVSARIFLGSRWDHSEARPVGRISGTCLLVSRRAWERIGPLSEDFFIYGEIHDWCERARRKGWEVWFEPGARAEHDVAKTASSLWSESERVGRIWDAHYRLLRIHKGRWATWLFALNYLASNGLAWLKVALFGGRAHFRERLAVEIWAHLSALSPAVLGRPGGPMASLLIESTQRLVAIMGMKFLSLFTTVAMARVLGRGRLGVATLVVGLVDVASLAAGQSLPSVAAKELADPREREDHGAILGVATLTLAASTALFAAPFFLIPVTLASLYGAPDMAIYLRVGGLLMIGGLGCGFLMSWFQGLEEISLMSKLQIFQSALTALAVLAWIPLHTVGTLLAALTAANWASLLVFAFAARRLLKRHHIRVSLGDERIWGKVLGFSVPATLAAFASWPQFWAISTILKLRSTFGAVGLFSVALQLPRNVIVFSQAIAAPYLPMVSRLHAGGSHGNVVKRVQRGIAAVVFLPSFFFALFSEPLLRLLYGRDFQAAWDVVIVLSAAWYLKSLDDAITNFLLGAGRLWWSLAFNLAALAALLASGWLLTLPYAAFGAGLAFLCAYGAYYLVSVWKLRRELEMPRKALAELAGVPLLFFGACFWAAPRLRSAQGAFGAVILTAAAMLWIARILTDPTASRGREAP